METNRTTARTRIVAAALSVTLAGCGLLTGTQQVFADEGSPEAQPAADQAATGQAADTPEETSGTEATPAPSSISATSLTADQIAADPALAAQAAVPSIGVNFQLTNDTASASALADIVNANRQNALTADTDLTSAAYQRAAESTLLNANIRPDGSLFTTVDATGTGRIVAELLVCSAPGTIVSDANTVYTSLSDDQRALLASEGYTNMGVGAVVTADGSTHWAILLTADGAPVGDSTVADGATLYYAATSLANTAASNFGSDISLEVGQSVAAPIPATVQGDIANGAGVSTFTYMAVNVNSNAGTWNSSNTEVASAVDGTVSGLAAGTCEVSMTNALSSQANTQYLYNVTVSGGENADAVDLADCIVAGITGPQPFNGTPVEPAFSLIDPNNQTVDPAFYNVTYENNDAPGEAELVVTANPDAPQVTGEKTYPFEIDGQALPPEGSDEADGESDAGTETAPDGSEQGSETTDGTGEDPAATDGGNNGEANPDETEEPGDTQPDAGDTDEGTTPAVPETPDGSETTEPGAPAEGDGANQGGTDEQPAQSQPIDLANEQVSIALADPGARFVYNGQEFKPAVVVKDGDRTLELNTDYTVSYENNVNAGTAQVVVTGASSLVSGTRTLSFTIEPQNIASYDAGPIVSATYNGSPVEQSKLEVKNGTSILRNGIDYTVSYKNNVNAGTATLRISGINNFAGEKELKFTITPASMAKTTVVMPNETHTGQALTPAPLSVTLGDIQLVAGVDYDVVGYANNTNVGNATATLQGKGNFEGTVVANWKIVQQGTSDTGTTQTLPKTGDTTNIVPVVVGIVAGVVLIGAAVALIVARGRSRKGR